MPYTQPDAVLEEVLREEKADPRQKALAYAIAEAENDTQGMYGVRSVRVSNRKEAARVLMNSIRNNQRRHLQAGAPGGDEGFVDFMGKRWAPPSAPNDPNNLNANWAGNVRSILKRSSTPQRGRR